MCPCDRHFHGNMTLFWLFASLFLAVLAAPYEDSHLDEWKEYKAKFNKKYETEEDFRRLEVYLNNKKLIEHHNRKYALGETTYTMGINRFTDWFPEELDRLNGLKISEVRPVGEKFQLPPDTDVPESINWVEKGAVTSVKDQGDCGSCYAFSAVGALEGLMFRVNKTIEDLSVQELVDCSGQYGCSGGYMVDCFEYVAKRPGIDSLESYPYEADDGTCRSSKGKVAAYCTGFKTISPGDEEEMKEVVGTVGPISISFAVGPGFSWYKSGVFSGSCSKYINHGMLAVGYDIDKETGEEYWLIKNSWGKDWGENGYVKVLRNENMCQIANACSYPVYNE